MVKHLAVYSAFSGKMRKTCFSAQSPRNPLKQKDSVRLPLEILLPFRDPLGARWILWGFLVELGDVVIAMVVDGKTFGGYF
jgi:hypothetical protein